MPSVPSSCPQAISTWLRFYPRNENAVDHSGGECQRR
nr:MAG TPA: endonuclease VIII [Caudoviricetes sp.]